MIAFENIDEFMIYYCRLDFAINNKLEFTTDSTDDVTIGIQYGESFSNYLSIKTITAVAGLNVTNISISQAAYTLLLNGEVTTNIKIELTQGGDSFVSDAFALNYSSLEILKPNTENNSTNLDAIFYKSYCNIVWTDTEKTLYPEVSIYIALGGTENWLPLIPIEKAYKTKNSGQYIFRPFDYFSVLGEPQGENTIDIKIASVSETISRYFIISTNISTDEVDCVKPHTFGDSDSIEATDYPDRFDTYARIAGEKAKFLDEAILKGQLEPGRGIRIIQRNEEGLANTADYLDQERGKSAAYNLVIETTEDVQLTLYYPIELTNTYHDAEYQALYGYAKYGTYVYSDLRHNWGLGERDNYIMDYTQKARVTSGSQINGRISECYAYPLDENTIRIYGIKKNNPNIFTGDDLAKEASDSMKFNIRLTSVSLQ